MEIYFYKARTQDQPNGSKKVPYSEAAERIDAGDMEQYFTYEQGPPTVLWVIVGSEKPVNEWAQCPPETKQLFTPIADDAVQQLLDLHYPPDAKINIDSEPAYNEGEDVGQQEESTPISNVNAFIEEKNDEGKYAVSVRVEDPNMIFDVFPMQIEVNKPRPCSVEEFKSWWNEGKP